jgi:hypothetical protein
VVPSVDLAAVSGVLGSLANFVWLAWAGLSVMPPSESTIVYRGVELPSGALDSYREMVGKSFVAGIREFRRDSGNGE